MPLLEKITISSKLTKYIPLHMYHVYTREIWDCYLIGCQLNCIVSIFLNVMATGWVVVFFSVHIYVEAELKSKHCDQS
jgi:hypothetical protein